MYQGFRLGRIAGIDVHVDWSVVIILFLVIAGLGSGVYPFWHPGWSYGFDFAIAAASAALLLVSILLHELAHAVTGRGVGVPVERITLFVFGGMAQLRTEPKRWKSELLMAFAGPLFSLALGALLMEIALTLSPRLPTDIVASPRLALASLGGGATMALWVGQINILLAAFNLIPGFPLDGGRVLRAVIWGITGDLRKSTRIAAGAGRLFGAALIACGILMIAGMYIPYLGGGIVGGLWMILIGWFLHSAAVMSYRQMLLRTSLEGVPVARLMHPQVDTVAGDMTVQQLVEQRLFGSSQRAFPVLSSGQQFAGIVCMEDLRRLPRSRWSDVRVAQIMTPASAVQSVPPSESVADAMVQLGRGGINQLPVLDHGELRGLISREDVLKLLAVYGDPALAS